MPRAERPRKKLLNEQSPYPSADRAGARANDTDSSVEYSLIHSVYGEQRWQDRVNVSRGLQASCKNEIDELNAAVTVQFLGQEHVCLNAEHARGKLGR